MQEQETSVRARDEKKLSVFEIKRKQVRQEHSDQDEIRKVSECRENYSMVVVCLILTFLYFS